MQELESDRRVIAQRLYAAVYQIIEFVRKFGPYEETGYYIYSKHDGLELDLTEFRRLESLDAAIAANCIALAIEPPPPAESNNEDDGQLFGYTRLRLRDWYSAEQPIQGPFLDPTVDWWHRMESLKKLAIEIGGPPIPKWDSRTRTLYWNGEEIANYHKHPAGNQTAILDAFEAQAWPTTIQGPIFNGRVKLDPKQLRDTASEMTKKIPGFRFSLLGDARVIGWAHAT